MPAPKVVNIKGKPKSSSSTAPSRLASASGQPTTKPSTNGSGSASPSPSTGAAKPDITIPTRVITFEDVPPAFKDIVDDLYQARRRAKAQEETATAERKNYDDLLDSLLIDMNVRKIMMPDGWYINLIKSTSASRIDPKLLLVLGVTADQIAAATVPGNPYKYVTVDESKSDKEK